MQIVIIYIMNKNNMCIVLRYFLKPENDYILIN